MNLSKFLNPGPLAKPHETLEGVSNCNSCHAMGSGVPDAKCLSCHKEIQTQLNAKAGYHAKQAGVACTKCHSDHKEKTYDLMGLSRISFNHAADADWPLTGAHAYTKCNQCHATFRTNVSTNKPTLSRTYLGSKTDCVSCHKDVHQSKHFEFKACEKCHATVNWDILKPKLIFSHTKETAYPLTGAHSKVNCYTCHKQKTWAPLKFAKCTDCHNDPHKGKFGLECTKCHNTGSWKQGAFISTSKTGGKKTGFDHNKTKFPLLGEHAVVKCEQCHGPKIGKMKNFELCTGCHLNPHGTQFSELWDKNKACTDCHIEDGWQLLKFQHNADSRYKLEGEHIRVPCRQCHVDTKYRWLPQTPDCSSCHIDVHKAQFARECTGCHVTKSFSTLTFDHNKEARFPLAGRHQKVQCSDCHEEGKFKDMDTRCQACHNDFHQKSLGIECTRCHAPTAFNDIEFDHNVGSRFKLIGKHTVVPCNQCHINFEYKMKDVTCAKCHLDVHKGSKGKKCEECHTPRTFSTKK